MNAQENTQRLKNEALNKIRKLWHNKRTNSNHCWDYGTMEYRYYEVENIIQELEKQLLDIKKSKQ